MERLTERTTDGIVVKEDYGEKVLKTIYECYGAEPSPHYANCAEGYCAMEKLAEYEDMEEQRRLVKLPCKTVYNIVDKGTKYATVMSKDIKDLTLYDIEGIDKKGYYFSTKEKAEMAMNGADDE